MTQLLDVVQIVLSSLDSDEVNSISDTVESQQVVKIVKSVYDDLLARSDVTVNQQVFNLTASADSTRPVLMTKPSYIEQILWIKYDKQEDGDTDPNWQEITYSRPLDFLNYTQEFKASEDYVDSFTYVSENGSSFTINYYNDRGPCYYTSFDDNSIIFDGIDLDVDTTLQSSKTVCLGKRVSSFEETDTFTFNLQPAQVNLLINEAKSLAWAELKQMPHQKAEANARRNWIHIGKTRQNIPSAAAGNAVHPFYNLPNFGRK